MSFEVTADAYARFMGRFSEPLADHFVQVASLQRGQRALDVGCGPGVLTERLVDRLDAHDVAAVDPSARFVEATSRRFPRCDVHLGAAENLPFADDTFDAALAQLVVHFMSDPVAGLAEMARVTRPGGVVAACVWDHADGGRGPLTTFWSAVKELDPDARDESALPGSRAGDLEELFKAAGLQRPEPSVLTVGVRCATFEDWWEPYTLGVGPAGAYVVGLDDAGREALRQRCEQRLPAAPFTVEASAWCVRSRP